MTTKINKKMYKIHLFNGKVSDSRIDEVDTIAISQHSVWLPNGTKERLVSFYHKYYLTKELAVKGAVEILDGNIQQVHHQLKNLEGMKETFNAYNNN